jgi:ABC-type polysaccharide/polyol phosphate transport system ATPase subunit
VTELNLPAAPTEPAEPVDLDTYDPGPMVLGKPRVIDPPAWTKPPAIVLEGAAKWYDRRKQSRARMALPRPLPDTPPPGAVVALDQIDLEIGEGQSVGIVGNNGAGKSTLLRLIAGVTFPARGTVAVRGHVASMIELGLGFHPEMTGRENLYFGAGLLGMSKATLTRRWDDIIEFSGVEHALDQQVKQYSSGMLARLGFSLASHSDADIILVDEVLSVGDFDFQRRSLERIMKLNREGRTTIIVTHNLDALPPLCHRIVQLDSGRLVADGTPRDVLPEYVKQERQKLAARSDNAVSIRDVEVVPDSLHPSDPITVRGTIEIHEPLPGCTAVVRVGLGAALLAWAGEDLEGETSLTRLADEPLDLNLSRGPATFHVDTTIASFPHFPVDYVVGLAVVDEDYDELAKLVVPVDVLGERETQKKIRLRLEQRNEREEGVAPEHQRPPRAEPTD